MGSLANVHPNALKKVRDPATAKYVSRGHQEFWIEQDGRFWIIKRLLGGRVHPSLTQKFTTFQICEQTLIQYLRSTDKFNKAIYPGCQEQ